MELPVSKFILFCSSTPHVSDGLSVHHQESKTVDTASGICQTDSANCLLAGTRWNYQFLKFILFCSSTLRVSVGLFVHHQESKTVHTASGICQTDSADCLLAGTRWNCYNEQRTT
jgi:hypothetical protein